MDGWFLKFFLENVFIIVITKVKLNTPIVLSSRA